MINSTFSKSRARLLLVSVSFVAIAAGMHTAVAQDSRPLPLTPSEDAQAQAQPEERPVVSKKKPPSSSAVNLINLLVQQGVLKEEQAANLIKQAEDEAYVSREAARDATSKADEAARAATTAAAAAAPSGSKRVTYVPEIVKRQLRDDLRKEVMAQARNEGWASPGKYPEWASRIRFYGDFRGRWEAISYPQGGYNATGILNDFNAINTGSPYDVSNFSNPFKSAPLYNNTEDRNRTRIRARLGLDADLSEGFTAGLRIATGSDSSPVSTNQTLGSSGSNFSKYALWLDRAYVKYEPFKDHFGGPIGDPSSVAFTVGRMDNPFWAPTDLMWDNDLGFDGIAFQARRDFGEGFTPFAVAGAFPIYNTALDFSTTQEVKYKSRDKYLLGGQIGFGWQAAQQVSVSFGAGIYDFSNVQGKLSTPCDLSVQTDCDTDILRPAFAQKGNTYMYLRDIIPNAANNNGKDNQLQYFGLASQYRPAVVSGRIDLGHFHPVHILIDGEYIKNTAFDRNTMERFAINNRAYDAVTGVATGQYAGGDMGWLARVTVGNTKLAQFGDWSAHVGYKYLQSDATLDAFADSDFGLGGTNLKGYFIGGSFALSANVAASARWMSANSIGPYLAPYAVDILQFDLSAKF